MALKLIFEPGSGKVLGAQAVGGAGVDKRIDVLSVAIQAGMTVFDLEKHQPIAFLPLAQGPDVVKYDPGLKRVYVACYSGAISGISGSRSRSLSQT